MYLFVPGVPLRCAGTLHLLSRLTSLAFTWNTCIFSLLAAGYRWIAVADYRYRIQLDL